MLIRMGFLVGFLIAGSVFIGAVQAEASPPQDYHSNFPAVALGIAAGVATWQVGYPTSIPDDGATTYHVVVDVSTNVAPLAGVALALATAGFAFSSPGCTVGVFVQDAVALNTVSGYVPITVASGTKYCYGTGRFTLTLLPPINVVISAYRVNWEFEVESVHNTNYDYLCDAPGITITAHNDGTTVCNDVAFSLSGTLNAVMSGALAVSGSLTISDDAGGWIIHQDPLSGTITVNCVGCNDTVSIGDTDVFVNATIDGNFTGQEQEATGFDTSLYVLFLFVALALVHLSERNGVYAYRMFGGIIFLVLGSISIWEQAKLGFDEVPGLLIPMWGFMLILGFYLIIPQELIHEVMETQRSKKK